MRREKIKALVVRGDTPGERDAAQKALDRAGAQLPLRITATVINIDRGQHFYDVSFTDVEGQTATSGYHETSSISLSRSWLI